MTLEIDPMLMTGARSFKRQKKNSELDNYFAGITELHLRASEKEISHLKQHPMAWWLEKGQYQHPTVFKMAVDFLSIPATSCECERCFSSAKRTITVDRNRLAPGTIEAVQLQKDWLKKGVVSSEMVNLTKHMENKA